MNNSEKQGCFLDSTESNFVVLIQVPLVVFKREKEVARSLEFDGMWIAEEPSDDDIRGHWDKLVISTRSFPDSYWDKFVKKKVICHHRLSTNLTSNVL